ncbi:ubiquinone biosynthesis protein COQ7 homolog, putative [Trypanosoma equiperdum]|uniref:5-demethoxyubiquinone hydroxylase, mitochondrial n=2 Tax=Trypanozoon TaxID=39700 RepID=Q582P6_TRYB2|nr:ubiquinone biosynthesis protein COQ7 homolog, putative [Trypanosoma brucei brucei TREU927]AAX80658.1 ubiquinone biosynthesis protein COQ7 homolog, putative [Trypanosoma brucei]AAZ10522.1 ubiquinone biosynthesis protein COQ7 homolog, putative [Trypanosoma brucei brucei TREU927]SCU68730.1 ubiquinone biosynthesis protein COQ7 homolog, putative [Trypanosoma equiperdum]
MLRRSVVNLQNPARVFRSAAKRQKLDEAVRVDQAGEVAAVRICKYQLLWMSPLDSGVPVVKEILRDELVHEEVMGHLARKHSVRLTLLDPLFHVGAFVMGSCTALLGKDAVMCCHAAVEVTIAQHYNDQLRELQSLEESEGASKGKDEKDWAEVMEYVARFRDEELHHQELGEQNGAENAPAYPLLYNGIRIMCSLGVALAKRI